MPTSTLTYAERVALDKANKKYMKNRCFVCRVKNSAFNGCINISKKITRLQCVGLGMQSNAPTLTGGTDSYKVQNYLIYNYPLNMGSWTSAQIEEAENAMLGDCGCPISGNCDSYYALGQEAAKGYPYWMCHTYRKSPNSTDNFYLDFCNMYAPYAYVGYEANDPENNPRDLTYGSDSPYNPYKIYPREEYEPGKGWVWVYGPSYTSMLSECSYISSFFAGLETELVNTCINQNSNDNVSSNVKTAAPIASAIVGSSSLQSISTHTEPIEKQKINFAVLLSDNAIDFLNKHSSYGSTPVTLSSTVINDIKTALLKPNGVYDQVLINNEINPNNPASVGFGFVKDEESEDIIVHMLAIEIVIT